MKNNLFFPIIPLLCYMVLSSCVSSWILFIHASITGNNEPCRTNYRNESLPVSEGSKERRRGVEYFERVELSFQNSKKKRPGPCLSRFTDCRLATINFLVWQGCFQRIFFTTPMSFTMSINILKCLVFQNNCGIFLKNYTEWNGVVLSKSTRTKLFKELCNRYADNSISFFFVKFIAIFLWANR